jgi:hypothetical protein
VLPKKLPRFPERSKLLFPKAVLTQSVQSIPRIVIDDQELDAGKGFSVVHPMNAAGKSVEDYRKLVAGD